MWLHLVDHNEQVVEAWLKEFAPFPEVTIQHADMLDVAEHCVVSPANSFGYMDGGIDAAYRKFFGAQIEQQVQELVRLRPEGHLPVGASIVLRTGHARVPFLIVAPTMTLPECVESRNCYRAMRAVLRIASANAEVGSMVYCPGLATGVGSVSPDAAAMEMAKAYCDWKSSA